MSNNIARDYGAMMAAEVLTPHALAHHIAFSPAHDRLSVIATAVLQRRLGVQAAIVLAI